MGNPLRELDFGASVQEAEWVSQLRQDPAPESRIPDRMVSEALLCHTLLALWDSGFYEYVRAHPVFEPTRLAEELDLEPTVLATLLGYLLGRGLLAPQQSGLALTELGQRFMNYQTRGLVTLLLGGYLPIFGQLGPLLRRELPLDAPQVARDGRLVSLGTAYFVMGGNMIDGVLAAIAGRGGKCVLDLGCGAGHFLIRHVLARPEARGVGIDLDSNSIQVCNQNASRLGAAERLSFFTGKVGAEPLPLPPAVLETIDTVTAMFILHEFGNAGDDATIAILRSLRAQLPGRVLLAIEVSRPDPQAFLAQPPPHYNQLDYWLCHPLSRQGELKTPQEWAQLFERAGCKLLATREAPEPKGIFLYFVGLPPLS